VAEARLAEIAEYVAQTSPVEAVRLVDRVTVLGESLRESPGRGSHFRGDSTSGLRQVIEGPLRLVYRIDEDDATVDILAVQHMAQGAPDVEGESDR
jgi:plasmid stabilization system protein ParE